MGKPGKKLPKRDAYGERVARERAARRRAAKERQHREAESDVRDAPEAEVTAEPEVVEIPYSDLANELSVLATLIAAGLTRSHPGAKRLFRDAGITVNDDAVTDEKAKLRLADVKDGVIKLSVGGKRHILLKPV